MQVSRGSEGVMTLPNPINFTIFKLDGVVGDTGAAGAQGLTGATGNTGTTGNTGSIGSGGVIVQATAPGSPTTGQQWKNTTDNILYEWDSVRAAWLSVSKMTFAFSANGNTAANAYLKPDGVMANTGGGFYIGKTATITSINGRKTDTANVGLSIRNNTTALAAVVWGAVNNLTNMAYDLDLAAGVVLQIMVTGATAANAIVVLEVAWRA